MNSWTDKIRSNTVEEHLDAHVGGRCAHVREEMLLVLRIAVFCTADDPKERPSAKEVRCMLSQIRIHQELV